MLEIVRRLVWSAVIATVCAYAGLLLLGGAVEVYANIIMKQPTIIRDRISPGTHQLSGMIMVHNSCDELLQSADKLSDTQYEITFQTWREPSTPCITEDIPREFHATVFAPSFGVQFSAQVDNSQIPIAVIRDLATTTIPLPDEQQ